MFRKKDAASQLTPLVSFQTVAWYLKPSSTSCNNTNDRGRLPLVLARRKLLVFLRLRLRPSKSLHPLPHPQAPFNKHRLLESCNSISKSSNNSSNSCNNFSGS